jgi:hypothetical protein
MPLVFLLLLILSVLPAVSVFADVETAPEDDVAATSALANTMVSNSVGTIMVWAQPTSVSGSTGTECNSNYKAMTDNRRGIMVGMNNTTLCALVFDDNANTINDGTSSANAWYHLALTWTGGTATFYVNGAAQTPVSSLTALLEPNQSLNLAGVASTDDSWPGRLADARAYSVALSAAEIAAIAGGRSYRFAKTQPTGWWPLMSCADGAAGNGVVFPDSSGNGNSMTADDGPDNTGFTCRGSLFLRNPHGVQ